MSRGVGELSPKAYATYILRIFIRFCGGDGESINRMSINLSVGKWAVFITIFMTISFKIKQRVVNKEYVSLCVRKKIVQ